MCHAPESMSQLYRNVDSAVVNARTIIALHRGMLQAMSAHAYRNHIKVAMRFG